VDTSADEVGALAVATPTGAEARTADGLAVLDAPAKSLSGCGPDELWRGWLQMAVDQYRPGAVTGPGVVLSPHAAHSGPHTRHRQPTVF
jgi:hypothetical protein